MVERRPLWVDDGSGPVRNSELTDQEFAAGIAELQAANVGALWQAAHDYEYAQISGSALGLVTLGVIQQKPKCLAVQAWVTSIWQLYYQRKPAVTEKWNDALMDFSLCGGIPFSVPELMAEISTGA